MNRVSRPGWRPLKVEPDVETPEGTTTSVFEQALSRRMPWNRRDGARVKLGDPTLDFAPPCSLRLIGDVFVKAGNERFREGHTVRSGQSQRLFQERGDVAVHRGIVVAVVLPLETTSWLAMVLRMGGTETREHRSPCATRAGQPHAHAPSDSRGATGDSQVPMAVALRAVSPGGALCRPCVSPRRCRRRYQWQVGRERPPLGCPLLRPGPAPEGVAHAPRTCPARPAAERIVAVSTRAQRRVRRKPAP